MRRMRSGCCARAATATRPRTAEKRNEFASSHCPPPRLRTALSAQTSTLIGAENGITTGNASADVRFGSRVDGALARTF